LRCWFQVLVVHHGYDTATSKGLNDATAAEARELGTYTKSVSFGLGMGGLILND
jgi:hypothetical protein